MAQDKIQSHDTNFAFPLTVGTGDNSVLFSEITGSIGGEDFTTPILFGTGSLAETPFNVIGVANRFGIYDYEDNGGVDLVFLSNDLSNVYTLSASFDFGIIYTDTKFAVLNDLIINTGDSSNPYFYHCGEIGGSAKYVSYQVEDTNDYYELNREDSSVVGFKVNMPLNIVTSPADVYVAGSYIIRAGILSKVSSTDDSFSSANNETAITLGMHMDFTKSGDVDNYGTGCSDGVLAHRFLATNDTVYKKASTTVSSAVGGVYGGIIDGSDVNATDAIVNSTGLGFFSDCLFDGKSTLGTHNHDNILLTGILESQSHTVSTGTVRNIMLYAYDDLMGSSMFIPKVGDENYVILDETAYPWAKRADNSKITLGAGDDYSIFFDGDYLNLYQEVASDGVKIGTANSNIAIGELDLTGLGYGYIPMLSPVSSVLPNFLVCIASGISQQSPTGVNSVSYQLNTADSLTEGCSIEYTPATDMLWLDSSVQIYDIDDLARVTNFIIGDSDITTNPYSRLYGYLTATDDAKYTQFQIDDTDDYLHLTRSTADVLGLKIDMPLASGNLTIGSGEAGVDYTITIDGETNDFNCTWMEDENYLLVNDALLMNGTATVYCYDTNKGMYSDGTDLILISDNDIFLSNATVIDNKLTLNEQLYHHYTFSTAGGSHTAYDLGVAFAQKTNDVAAINNYAFYNYASRTGTLDDYTDGFAETTIMNGYWFNDLATYSGTGNLILNHYAIQGIVNSSPTYNSTGYTATINNYGLYSYIGNNLTLTNGDATITNYGAYFTVNQGAGGGTYTNYGIYIDINADSAASYGIWDASGKDWILDADNQAILFGAGQDASIEYDGTNLVVNPHEVGTGGVKIITDTNTYFLTEYVDFDLSIFVEGLVTTIPVLNGTSYSTMPELFPVPYATGIYDQLFIIDKSENDSPRITFTSLDITHSGAIGMNIETGYAWVNWDWCPDEDETYSLGHSDLRWIDGCFSGTGYFDTSVESAYFNATDETTGYQIDGNRIVSFYSNVSGINYYIGSSGNFTHTGQGNVSIGESALISLTEGIGNFAMGKYALYHATTGSDNIAVGVNSLVDLTEGIANVAIGWSSGLSLTTGDYNVILGEDSLRTNVTGSNNVSVGYRAGYTNLGDNNIFLGEYAGYYETGSNSFYVNNQDRDNTAGDKAGSLLYGTFNATPASQTLVINAATTVNNSLAASEYNIVCYEGDVVTYEEEVVCLI